MNRAAVCRLIIIVQNSLTARLGKLTFPFQKQNAACQHCFCWQTMPICNLQQR